MAERISYDAFAPVFVVGGWALEASAGCDGLPDRRVGVGYLEVEGDVDPARGSRHADLGVFFGA